MKVVLYAVPLPRNTRFQLVRPSFYKSSEKKFSADVFIDKTKYMAICRETVQCKLVVEKVHDQSIPLSRFLQPVTGCSGCIRQR